MLAYVWNIMRDIVNRELEENNKNVRKEYEK